MHNTFHKLNAHGLETFQQWLCNNQGKHAKLPTYLIQDPQYFDDSKIAFDTLRMEGMDLWQVGKNLIPIIDNEPRFHDMNFQQVWSSLSLYFADLILPETYNGKKRKILEGRRYAIEKGRNRYKHLLYCAYLCNKTWGDDSKYLLPQNFTNVQYDKFLGSASLYRYKDLFWVIKKLYIEQGAKPSSKKDGGLSDFMKFILQYAVNHSLAIGNINNFYDIIPDVYKQHSKKYGRNA